MSLPLSKNDTPNSEHRSASGKAFPHSTKAHTVQQNWTALLMDRASGKKI